MPSVALVCADGGHRGRLLALGAPPGAFDIDLTDDGGMMVPMALASLEDGRAALLSNSATAESSSATAESATVAPA